MFGVELAGQAIAEGLAQGAWQYNEMKRPPEEQKPALERIDVLAPTGTEAFTAGHRIGAAIGSGQTTARGIQVLPGNVCTPSFVARSAEEIARRHGFDVEQANPSEGAADEFVVDSIIRAPRPFQGHNEVRITGRWRHVQRTAMSQRVFIAAAGRLEGALAMYLLDPESDDGFTTWGLFGDRLRVGEPHPVLRQRMGGSSGR